MLNDHCEGLACSVDHACEIDRASNREGCREGGDGDLGRDCVRGVCVERWEKEGW